MERRLIYVIAAKALLYLALLVFLSIAEEVIVGIIHGRTITASLSDLGGDKLPQIFATSFIMLLILVPYFASVEINSSFEGGLWRMMLTRRSGPRRRV